MNARKMQGKPNRIKMFTRPKYLAIGIPCLLLAISIAYLAFAQANEDLVDVSFDPRQLVMDLHQTVTPAKDAE